MKSTYEKKEIPIHVEFCVIKCGNCNHKFVFIPVVEDEDDVDVYQNTASVWYCPFCGVKDDH
jgi:uncharacterized protein with PIN domain